ncbi:MAG: SRPBCC domain-containing protein [bacterium]
MREVRTTIDIAAPPTVVWEILTDFARYSEWNPQIPFLTGEAAKNARLVEQVLLPDGKLMTFHPTITECKENRELRWVGTFLFAAIFAGEHYFELEPRDDGRGTRLKHGETWTGLMVEYFPDKVIPPGMEDTYEKVNLALKKRAEEIAAKLPPVEAVRHRIGDLIRG